MERLLSDWERMIADDDQQLELLRSGTIRTREDNLNTTEETIVLIERMRDDLDRLISRHAA